jgi:predicted CoA-binding protein
MLTLVMGASLNPERYSFLAVNRLRENNIPTLAFGLKSGTIADVTINTTLMPYNDIHTVTLYLNPQRQKEFYDYILSLHPKRVIFNTGTENDEFIEILEKNKIYCEVACTLVLLRTAQYEKM